MLREKVNSITARAYTIPTDAPESDGTYEWDSTTLVLVHARAGDKAGVGYSYTDSSAAHLINGKLASLAKGLPAMSPPAAWDAMLHGVRNLGLPGIAANAISAVDTALWDLKARLLDLPLAVLLGPVRERAPLYGSGGFTSYSEERLVEQMGGWVDEGFKMVKMKVGRDSDADRERVFAVRDAIGDDAELFVDANGGYSRKLALEMASVFVRDAGVTWFEEPRPSEDLEGLRLLRDNALPGMDITAGEYGYHLQYFKRMLEAQAVDCMQADITRCCGLTGFMQVADLCDAHMTPLSAHCAPNLHLHACLAMRPLRHIEYFHDHARIEQMLFDGARTPEDGMLAPDWSAPGMGLALKESDAEQYAV